MTDTFTLLGTTFNNVAGFRATDSDGIVQTFSQGGAGASNFAHGTFSTGSVSGAFSLTIPYTGTGYPIVAAVVVAGGMYDENSTWYNYVDRYAVGQWTMIKSAMTRPPTYATTGTQNYGVVNSTYKGSTSTATSYSRSGGQNVISYAPADIGSAGAAATTCVRFQGSSTKLTYYVKASSYGLAPGFDYEYFIVYSE